MLNIAHTLLIMAQTIISDTYIMEFAVCIIDRLYLCNNTGRIDYIYVIIQGV